jgi:GntR family transcriptional regulator
LAEDLSTQSLYRILSQKYRVTPTRASQSLDATGCPVGEAALLEVRKGSPVLHIHRTTYDQNGRPFEQVESFYRGDRYIFYAELSSEEESTR